MADETQEAARPVSVFDAPWTPEEVARARTLLPQAQAVATTERAIADALQRYADEHDRQACEAERRVAMYSSIIEQGNPQEPLGVNDEVG